jgi:hypothetical protein
MHGLGTTCNGWRKPEVHGCSTGAPVIDGHPRNPAHDSLWPSRGLYLYWLVFNKLFANPATDCLRWLVVPQQRRGQFAAVQRTGAQCSGVLSSTDGEEISKVVIFL